MAKKALGRGLSVLIPEKPKVEAQESIGARIINLKIDEVIPSPYQPRKEFQQEALRDLTASIKEKGILQPIIVRKKEDGGYELIAGERRLRAAKSLQHKEIQAIVKDANDEESLELSLIENIQREGLNPLEEAHAYQELVNKFNFTQDKIAQVVGKARATINNTLRILKLPPKVQEQIKKNLLSFSHARALLELESADQQIKMANKIVSSELSVRELEGLLKSKRPLKVKKRKTALSGQDPYAAAIEEELRHLLGTKVKIVQHNKRGRLEIEFYSPKDLERILEVLRGEA